MDKLPHWAEAVVAWPGAFIVETQEKALAAALVKLGVSAIRHTLRGQPRGDVLFVAGSKLVGVERKTTADLLAAWTGKQKDGRARLTSQLETMLECVDVVVLVVEGWYGLDPSGYVLTERRWNKRLWDGLWNHLDRWQARGVRLQLTVDVAHTARRLVSLRDYWRRRIT